MRISHLRREIAVNPHDSPAKYDLARTYIDRGRYQAALDLIESLPPSMLSAAVPDRALQYLREFQKYNVSSCESQYRLALLLAHFDDHAGERDALHECLATYRVLPKFRRRAERRWATLARLRLLGATSGGKSK